MLILNFQDGWSKEIIIVNDGSKDKTFDIMKDLAKKFPEVKIFENERNMGKTQTVKNGLLKTKGDVVVIQDADFEYYPEEIPTLLEKMIKESLDVVYGNRFGKKNKVIYWKNYYGNRFLSAFSNLFTYPRIKTWIPDMEVCYKMVNGDIFRELAKTIESKSTFGLEPEVTAKLSKYKKDGKHLKFGIIAISYKPRTIEEGKKMHAFKDGSKALFEILKFNLFK
ncbi:MAG: glycosyl transferase [Candidatus Dojkabacteria bacterium]|nr:MAG: glycosyl transferase [Candidatus Dojkabacteria bacterium]